MSDRLRIVRVLPFFERVRYGGSAAQAHATSAALAARGHDVRVLTTDLGQQDPALPRGRWVPRDGYRVCFCAAARSWHRVPPYLPPPGFVPELVRALDDADLVTANVGLTLVNAVVRRHALRRRIPYVYNAEGSLCPTRLRARRVQKAVFMALVERRVLRDAAAVQAVTERESADLRAAGADPDRVVVIPNGVAPADLGPASAGQVFRRQHQLPADAVVVLFLGRLAPEKGLDLMFGSAAGVLGERGDLFLVVAGPDAGSRGRAEATVARLGIGSRVRFTGPLAAAERDAALLAADVFALTSYSEGLPNAVLEAAAAGLPLWLTDACNVPEVARCGAGIVARPDPNELEAGLRRLVGDAAFRARCADNARAMVSQHFALDAVVDRLEALYRGLV